MPAKRKTAKKKTHGKAAAVGFGLLAAGVATYLLSGERGKKNRAKVKKWSSQMKRDLAKEVKALKTVSQKDYQIIVQKLAKKYEKIDKDELRDTVNEMKKHWQQIKKRVSTKKKATPKRKPIARKRKTKK